ncbi:MAG: tetratricopeptide repeat protein [Myxococcota bacterium]
MSPLPMVLLMALAAPARAQDATADAAEWKAFQDTLERYSERMKEFQGDARSILDAHEAEERGKISSSYGAAMRRLEESEDALRRVAITRIEGFLQKYPDTKHSPDMLFRLADLYFEEAEIAFSGEMDAYSRLEEQVQSNPNMILPPPPLKDYSRPIALYRQVIDRYPQFEYTADTYYMLAWCHSVQNAQQYDADVARDVYQTIVDRYPGSVFGNDANMRLGEYYFDAPGTREDPTVNVRLAIKYYEAVLADGEKGRNYDKAIYKLGWSHYKLNDYDRALAYLVQLLDYSDQQFLETGKEASTRKEAIEYLAISYADIAERQARKPWEVAMAHLDKVGDRKWQHEVVERLADLLWVQAKWEASIDTYTFMQDRWPTDPMNPVYQQNVALLWGGSPQNAFDPPQARPPMPFPDQAKSDAAFQQLSEKYVDGKPWYNANRNNPDAIARARGYIEESLAQVATGLLVEARESGDPVKYQLAAEKFREYLDKFPFANDYDTYEWYLALAYYESNQFPEAEKAYAQILKNDRSQFREGARFQLMATRRQLLLAKFGKLEEVPADATTERVIEVPGGEPITVYALSDEHKAFIAACDDLVEREFSDPDWAPVLERDRAALAYLPAQILYNHGRFEEARPRFEKVIARFPKKDEALYSASLMTATYQREANKEKTVELITKYVGMNLGSGELSKSEMAKMKDTLEGTKYLICYDFSEKKEHLPAADCYGTFMTEYPKSQYFDEALYSAANNFELGGKAEESNRLFEKYINLYPSNELSKGLYFRIASNYSSTLDLQKSIQYYEQLAKLFPTYVDAPAALFNAAFLRVGVGDHAGAARAYEKYASLTPPQPDAEQIYWRAGEQWELVSDAEALTFYQNYLRKFPSSDPNHVIEAWHRISKLYAKKGDTRRSADALKSLQQAYLQNAGASLTSRSRSLAAEIALKQVLDQYETFKLVKWTNNEAKNVDILTKQKPEELKRLTDAAVLLIQTYQDYDTAAASLYIQGMAYYAYADMAYNCPPPKGLTEDELVIYQDTIAQQFQIPSEDRAKARLTAALEKAKTEKRWSDWNSKMLAALNEREPTNYPAERRESRGAATTGGVDFSGPMSAPAAEKK